MRSLILALLCVLLVQGCRPTDDPGNFCSGGDLSLQNTTAIASDLTHRVQNDSLLITFKKGLAMPQARRLFGRTLKRHWGQFDIGQGLIDDPSFLMQMMGDGRVLAIEENHRNHILQPRPQCLRPSFNLDTIPAGVFQIHGPQAWRSNGQSFTFGGGVKVAVLDTGIHSLHPDLLGRVAGGVNFIPQNGVVLSSAPVNENNWQDDHGHGTEVAGVIGAGANLWGIVGVAPAVQLYAVKTQALDGAGSTSTLIDGLQWAVAHHMDIVNMSFGSGDYSVAAERAVDDATAAGLVLVAAAGNTGDVSAGGLNLVEYPAAYRNVVSVGAVTSEGQRWPGSAFNSMVDISAPGANVLTTAMATTENPDQHICVDGTSVAAPHVSGVFALVKERFPDLSAYDLKRRVVCSATDVTAAGRDDHTGYGIVDGLQALMNSYVNCNYLQRADNPSNNAVPVPSRGGSDAYFDSLVRSLSVSRVQTKDYTALVLTAVVVNGLGAPVPGLTLQVRVENESGQSLQEGAMTSNAQGFAQIALYGAQCGNIVFRIVGGARQGFQFSLNDSATTASFRLSQ